MIYYNEDNKAKEGLLFIIFSLLKGESRCLYMRQKSLKMRTFNDEMRIQAVDGKL